MYRSANIIEKMEEQYVSAITPGASTVLKKAVNKQSMKW